MEYLRIKAGEKLVRSNGERYAVPLFIKKTSRFGKVISEKAISIRKSILVTGAHDSGKSRWAYRLYEKSDLIWRKKAPALFLSAFSPIGVWVEHDGIAKWYETWEGNKDGANFLTLKQHLKIDLLSQYIFDTRAVLLIDDAHKLSGRKLKTARECLLASRLFVVTSSDENRIAPNLRTIIERRNPQIFRLKSTVSYDATNIIIYALMGLFAILGWWEISLVLGGLKALSGGVRSARSD
jgi:hypothetical protein